MKKLLVLLVITSVAYSESESWTDMGGGPYDGGVFNNTPSDYARGADGCGRPDFARICQKGPDVPESHPDVIKGLWVEYGSPVEPTRLSLL